MDLLRHLTYFVAVAEELHFGRAARRLHMAQPPLSQRIRGLEQHLDVVLFDRSSRRVDLTPAGRLLLPEARELIARAGRVETLASRMRADEPAELRAAVMPALSAHVLAAVVERFSSDRPDVRLDLREIGDEAQLTELRSGSLDVGVVRRPADLDGLQVGRTLSTPLGVIVAASSALADADDVELSALAGLELVTFARESAPAVYDELLAECRAHGFAPAAIRVATGAQFAAGLVLAGRAVALSGPTTPAPGCVWRPIAGVPLRWTVCTVRGAGASDDFADTFESAVVAAMLGDGWDDAGRPGDRATRLRPAYGLLA